MAKSKIHTANMTDGTYTELEKFYYTHTTPELKLWRESGKWYYGQEPTEAMHEDHFTTKRDALLHMEENQTFDEIQFFESVDNLRAKLDQQVEAEFGTSPDGVIDYVKAYLNDIVVPFVSNTFGLNFSIEENFKARIYGNFNTSKFILEDNMLVFAIKNGLSYISESTTYSEYTRIAGKEGTESFTTSNPWRVVEAIILHEMAHFVSFNLNKGKKISHHGTEFVEAYATLREEFNKNSDIELIIKEKKTPAKKSMKEKLENCNGMKRLAKMGFANVTTEKQRANSTLALMGKDGIGYAINTKGTVRRTFNDGRKGYSVLPKKGVEATPLQKVSEWNRIMKEVGVRHKAFTASHS